MSPSVAALLRASCIEEHSTLAQRVELSVALSKIVIYFCLTAQIESDGSIDFFKRYEWERASYASRRSSSQECIHNRVKRHATARDPVAASPKKKASKKKVLNEGDELLQAAAYFDGSLIGPYVSSYFATFFLR